MKIKRCFWLWCIFIVIMFSGCTSRVGYETYEETCDLGEGYSFNYIQVRGMEDQELQEKINASLVEPLDYLTKWGFIEKEQYTVYAPVIHFKSDKYLSVENMIRKFEGEKSRETLCVCVTVDMETGEAVYLDDLVRLDEEFAEYFIKKDVARREKWSVWTAEEMTELANEIYADMGAVSVLRVFMDLSKEKESRDYEVHIRGGIYFYLEEGCLVYNHGDGLVRTRIDLKDIKDFLKVEMW